MPEFYMIYARKNNKMPEFYIIFDRKIFFPNFFFLGGGGASAPLPPVSYAYDACNTKAMFTENEPNWAESVVSSHGSDNGKNRDMSIIELKYDIMLPHACISE